MSDNPWDKRSYLGPNEILILRFLLNKRLCINCLVLKTCHSTEKCDMVVHQTPRLISVFVHCTPILLVWPCGFSSGSLLFSIITFFSHTTKTVTSWADAQTVQIVSFEILVLFRLCKYCKRHAYIMPKSPSNSVDPDTS